jgi:hypothetical protein
VPDKLYVVVRGDLSPGQQATQSVHAALAFAYEHPAVMARWYADSTYLVLLAVPDLAGLEAAAARLSHLVVTAWHEPDMGGELTAVVVEPGAGASRLLSNLPLTLRVPAMSG